jgi:hypothetical protein
MPKVNTVTSLKAYATKFSTYRRRIHKHLTVQIFSASLVNWPFMLISKFYYNKLIKENKKNDMKRKDKIRRIASMASPRTP